MQKTYIVASCKTWHRQSFEQLARSAPANWLWVENNDQLLAAAQASAPRYIFFLHWSWQVPQHIWTQIECVCFHMTDVPYGRGGSPLQNLIVAGHSETRLTALRMVEAMDAGPVYAKAPLSLAGRAEDIYRRAGDLSFDIIRQMIESEPTPEPQHGDVVVFKRRRPEQSELPTTGSLQSVYDHIRMLDAETYPLAFIEHGNFRLEFSHARRDGDDVVATVVIRQPDPEQER